MKTIYLDTNIFIYFADKKSEYFSDCLKLLSFCQKNNIIISTSLETIQEIIHYSQKLNQLSEGIAACKMAMKAVNELLSVSAPVIDLYLKLMSIHQAIPSRDVLHAATMLTFQISVMITYDKHLLQMKEINALKPKSFLNEAVNKI